MLRSTWIEGLNIPNNSSIFGGLKSLAFEFQGSVCEAFKLPSLQDAFLGFKVMVPLDNGEMKYFKQKFHQVSSDTEGRGQSTPWEQCIQTGRSFSHWKNEGHKIQEPKKSWMDDIPKILHAISVQFSILSFALSTMPSSLLSPQTVRGNTAMANLEGMPECCCERLDDFELHMSLPFQKKLIRRLWMTSSVSLGRGICKLCTQLFPG